MHATHTLIRKHHFLPPLPPGCDPPVSTAPLHGVLHLHPSLTRHYGTPLPPPHPPHPPTLAQVTQFFTLAGAATLDISNLMLINLCQLLYVPDPAHLKDTILALSSPFFSIHTSLCVK